MEKRLDDSDVYIVSLQEKIKTLVTEKETLLQAKKALEEEKEQFQVILVHLCTKTRNDMILFTIKVVIFIVCCSCISCIECIIDKLMLHCDSVNSFVCHF